MRNSILFLDILTVLVASLSAYLMYEKGAFRTDPTLNGEAGGSREEPASTPESVPDDTSEPSVRVKTEIGQGASALDVRIVPIEVVEDSRCPIDAVCIWEGTLKVRVLLESGLGAAEQVFEPNQSITTEAEIVTLIGVEPEHTSTTETIGQGEYVFHFEIRKRTD